MSPLVTFLVIMSLVVVYNESQHVADFQDVYQNIFKENSVKSCNPATQRKRCDISIQGWRKLFNDNNALDYIVEDAPKYIELLNDDFPKKINGKRGYHHNDHNYEMNCKTEKNAIDLGGDYFPNLIANISCKHNEDFQDRNRICLEGSNCQPVIHNVRVLKRRRPNEFMQQVEEDMPWELRDCWKFVSIPIEAGCRCYRSY